VLGLLQTIGSYPFALILRIVRAVAEESAALAGSEACDPLASFISYRNHKNDKVELSSATPHVPMTAANASHPNRRYTLQ
jgi:hypothetical protein